MAALPRKQDRQKTAGKYLIDTQRIKKPVPVIGNKEPNDALPTQETKEAMALYMEQRPPGGNNNRNA